MFWLLKIIIVCTCIIHASTFVLLQVRKQNDTVSKIDALIHRIVPNDKVMELKKRFAQGAVKTVERMSFDNPNENKDALRQKTANRIALRELTLDKKNGSKGIEEKSLESVVLTGVKNMLAHEKRPVLFENISKKILDFVKNSSGSIFNIQAKVKEKSRFTKSVGPSFRSEKKRKYIKKAGNTTIKNPVVLKLDSNTIIDLLAVALNSSGTQQIIDNAAKTAGVALRSAQGSDPARSYSKYDVDRI